MKNGWRPMEEAFPAPGEVEPRGGKRIMVWYHHNDYNTGRPIEYKQVGIAIWIAGGRQGSDGTFQNTGEGNYHCDGPSTLLAWKPLPEGPEPSV